MWNKTITLQARIVVSCPLSSDNCMEPDHEFIAEATAQLPLTFEREQEIRTKLQEQVDAAIAKFWEKHQ